MNLWITINKPYAVGVDGCEKGIAPATIKPGTRAYMAAILFRTVSFIRTVFTDGEYPDRNSVFQ